MSDRLKIRIDQHIQTIAEMQGEQEPGAVDLHSLGWTLATAALEIVTALEKVAQAVDRQTNALTADPEWKCGAR